MSSDATEFARRLNLPQSYKEHIDGGSRSMDVVVKIRGIEVARKTTLYSAARSQASITACQCSTGPTHSLAVDLSRDVRLAPCDGCASPLARRSEG
jgi:hypothetical protein